MSEIIEEIKKEENGKAIEANDSEFAYLKRGEFTSEIYKIEVRNLGYFGIGEFKKLLKKKLELNISKVKSPLGKEFAFVCFRSEEHQQKAIQILNGYKWKGKILQATLAKASVDPLQRKRKLEQAANGDLTKPKQLRTSFEATCPLADVPYEEQLKEKLTTLENLLQTFFKELKNANRNVEMSSLQGILNGLGIEPSPQIEGYRNKNEFTIGRNSEGETIVGFRVGSYADGSVEVSAIDNLPHIPQAAKWAARTFQEFVIKSKFQPFNPEDNSGHFRQLMVRTSAHTKEIMLVAGIYSSRLNHNELEELKQELKTYYACINAENSDYQCTSLYYQDVQRHKAGQVISPIEHLDGSTHIIDKIHDLDFRISPLAFFQINTAGANILYQKAIELAKPHPQSIVLDICCGTGTIALAFAKHCKRVVGVDIVSDAIKDAEYNAIQNRIENCKFLTGDADDYIQTMVNETLYDNLNKPLDIIAIIDPPRAGLRNRSILAIRAATAIKRLVYISCNPQHAKRNWIDLGRSESKQYKGKPFYPKSALAIDMFPHTRHTEVIMLFERDLDNNIGGPEAIKKELIPANVT